MRRRVLLIGCIVIIAVTFSAAGSIAYAHSPKLPQAKITHICSGPWFESDYKKILKEEGYEPEYVYFDSGAYNDYRGHYITRIDVACSKEKGNVKYQFAERTDGKKWDYFSFGKSRFFYSYDHPKNKTYYVKVRTFKTIKGKRYYGRWSPVMKESTHDKEVHVYDVYTKDRYVKGYIKGAFKGEKIKVLIGKKKYSTTIKKTSRKYKFKIYVGKHTPGQRIKVKLYSPTGDTQYTSYNIRMYYARKIARGYTKKQVKWTDNWGSPDSTASASGGWSYWYYDDGSYVTFKHGRVRSWYYVN